MLAIHRESSRACVKQAAEIIGQRVSDFVGDVGRAAKRNVAFGALRIPHFHRPAISSRIMESGAGVENTQILDYMRGSWGEFESGSIIAFGRRACARRHCLSDRVVIAGSN